MATTYTKTYVDAYPGGWKAKPDLSTPYTDIIKNNEVATFKALENYLYNNPLPTSIGDLTDVDLTDIENGNVLVWDATAGKFVPGEGGGGGTGGGGSKIYYPKPVHSAYGDFSPETEVGEDELGRKIYARVYVDKNSAGIQPIDGSTTASSLAYIGGVDTDQRVIVYYEGSYFFEYSGQTLCLPINYFDGFGKNDYIITKPDIWSPYALQRSIKLTANTLGVAPANVKFTRSVLYIEYYKTT